MREHTQSIALLKLEVFTNEVTLTSNPNRLDPSIDIITTYSNPNPNWGVQS